MLEGVIHLRFGVEQIPRQRHGWHKYVKKGKSNMEKLKHIAVIALAFTLSVSLCTSESYATDTNNEDLSNNLDESKRKNSRRLVRVKWLCQTIRV